MDTPYAIEMLHITKRFPGIIANDDITLRVKKGEIHALLGENGAGKSTLMSVLFGLYQPEEGIIKKDGVEVSIKDPNDANALGIGMVHQHFKLVECFSVLDNIILGVEPTKHGFLQKKEARQRVLALSEKYGLKVDPDALIEDITVGMQQRTEILKMLYRENEILIFDEPTAVLTPQEIDELMEIMRNLAAEGKSILFISHKLNEIMAVADRCTVLRKGKYVGTVETKDTSMEQLSAMMVGRNVNFHVEKKPSTPGDVVLDVAHMTVASKIHKNNAVRDVSLKVRRGEIVCLAGIDGNGQTEFVYGLTGLEPLVSGKISLCGKDITHAPMHERARLGIGMSFQRPPTIHGLPTGKLVELCGRGREMDIPAMARTVHFDQFLDRDVNAGFSGGEIKRSELLQLMAQRPDLLLFDEPESGVDLENMALVGKTVRQLLDGVPSACSATLRERERRRSTSGLIITHTGHILEYVNAHRGQVMYHGKLCCEARPREILDHIANHGYQECLRCLAGDMYGKIAEAPLL